MSESPYMRTSSAETGCTFRCAHDELLSGRPEDRARQECDPSAPAGGRTEIGRAELPSGKPSALPLLLPSSSVAPKAINPIPEAPLHIEPILIESA